MLREIAVLHHARQTWGLRSTLAVPNARNEVMPCKANLLPSPSREGFFLSFLEPKRSIALGRKVKTMRFGLGSKNLKKEITPNGLILISGL